MAENYVVNYDIKVRSTQALESIRKFQQATTQLDECAAKLTAFQKKVEAVTSKFAQMSRKAPVFDIQTTKANRKLDTVISKLEKIHRLAAKTASLNVGASGGPSRGSRSAVIPAPSGGGSAKTPAVPKPVTAPKAIPARSIIPKNIGYRNLGPTMIDSGGIGAFNIAKGMGIAYGIAGLGSMMGNVVKEASEYNNLMQTTRNILQTHDKQPGFARRFNEMEHIVRNVGIETKFTAPQVADASKFLAMAGFDIDAINKSIRPISDIALVGDTDLGQTADVVTNIMTGYGISPDKIRRASDVMTMTFTKTNTTLMEIAEAYKYSASLLSAGGVSFETATAGIGILGDAGIKGSQAGTTMRTIMANLVNPTKKQSAHWQKIGVSTMDKNGQTRDLPSIFKDLNEKGLGVSDYYKLFHKTAAQGAVSLAANVDKWNEVVFKNFLSDGLVHKLAEEKKNTIQGLWYQLTSMFTEDGMVVFEGMQDTIKGFLKETTAWLSTPQAVETLKGFASNLFELVKMLKDMAIWLSKVYNVFSPFINMWIKFQVVMWPILGVLRALKAIGNSGLYFVSLIAGATRLAGSLSMLRETAKGLMASNIMGTITSWFSGNWNAGKERAKMYLPQAGNVAQEAGKVTQTKGVGAKKASGSIGLFSLHTAGAFATVSAFTYLVYKAYDSLNDLRVAYGQWYEKVYATKGYLSEGLSPTERYLKLVHDKQLTVNEKVEEYIRLRREELGLTSQALNDLSGKTIKEAYSDIIKSRDKGSFWRAFSGSANTANEWQTHGIALSYLPKYLRDQYDLKEWSHNGQASSEITKNGRHYSKDLFARDMFLSSIGYDSPIGKEFIEEFTKAFESSPANQWGEIRQRMEARLTEFRNKLNPNLENASLDEIYRLDTSKILTLPIAYETFANRVRSAFNFTNPGNENAKKLSSLQQILSAPGALTTTQQAELLSSYGVGSFADFNDSESWYRKWGFDQKTGKFVGTTSTTADEAARKFYNEVVSGAVEVLNSLGSGIREKMTILSSPMSIASWQQSQIKDSAPKIGDERYVNGVLCKYTFNAPTGKYEWVPVKGGGINDGADGGGGDTTGADFGAGADQSRYKSHYNQGSAAPKQIIVKIENLMNVESIDLSNKDNAAAINNTKQQLAQMLIDVVHDFDDSFHG